MLTLLKSVCLQLEQHGIEYMLSGSLALNAYTVPRMTRDIDIVIALKEEHLTPFLSIFSKETTYFSTETIHHAVKQPGIFNIIDFKTGYKVDFIVLKPEPFRQTEFARKIRSEVFGFPAWMVRIEDLILSKLIWIQELMSDRQTEDLKHLCSVQNIDWKYVQSWVQQLQLNTYGLFDHV